MLLIIISFSCCCCSFFVLFICCKKNYEPPQQLGIREEDRPNDSENIEIREIKKQPSDDKEKIAMINELRKVIVVDQFEKARRQTLHNPQNQNGDGVKFYDETCSICMERFDECQKIMLTHCNHSFHENCLMGWITTKVEKVLKAKKRRERAGEPQDNEGDGVDCPNCNSSLTKAAENKEIEAADQIGQLLASSCSKMVDEEDIDIGI